MVHKSAVQKDEKEDSYRLSRWRLFCFNADRFELDFQRRAVPSSRLVTVSISSDGPRQYFTSVPSKPPGIEIWRLRMTWASVQSLADLPQFDFTETSLAPNGRRLASLGKFSTEGLSSALAGLIATCPAAKGTAPSQTSRPGDSAAK
jgi:hypothetical protein